jgi:hypothetical protein
VQCGCYLEFEISTEQHFRREAQGNKLEKMKSKEEVRD